MLRRVTEAISDLSASFPGAEDPELARALLKGLGQGQPIDPHDLAAQLERPDDAVRAALDRWHNVHRDTTGHITAFGGLSLDPTAHELTVNGQRLYAWCAWDTLFLPSILNASATVRSTCPITRTRITLTISPDRVESAEPQDLQVSFIDPSGISTPNIIDSFCCHVLYLAGQHAADRWLENRPNAFTLSLQDAFELGQLATAGLRN